MTREQIKQNAIAYANKAAPITGQNKGIPLAIHTAAEVAYINGAHSRDEEIKELEEEIESLKENEKELFEGFKKRGTKLGELMKENVKLHNPWISVKDKLPDKAWDNKMGHLTEDSDIVLAVSSSGKLFSNLYYSYHLHEWLEKGAGLNGMDRVLQCYKITHWMPIPELPKGGEI